MQEPIIDQFQGATDTEPHAALFSHLHPQPQHHTSAAQQPPPCYAVGQPSSISASPKAAQSAVLQLLLPAESAHHRDPLAAFGIPCSQSSSLPLYASAPKNTHHTPDPTLQHDPTTSHMGQDAVYPEQSSHTHHSRQSQSQPKHPLAPPLELSIFHSQSNALQSPSFIPQLPLHRPLSSDTTSRPSADPKSLSIDNPIFPWLAPVFHCPPDSLPDAPPPALHPQKNALSFCFGDFSSAGNTQTCSNMSPMHYMQAQNGDASASRQPPASTTPEASRSVFNRLGHTPPQQHQPSALQQPTSQKPHQTGSTQISLSHQDLPPGFASPGNVTDQSSDHSQDLPPGFQGAYSSSAPRSAQRSRMRSDHMPKPAQADASTQRSAQSAWPTPGQGQSPKGPPGFEGLPQRLAQRLSPSPAQHPQVAVSSLRAASSSPEHPNANGAMSGHGSQQHQPAAAYDASSDDSSDQEPPGFARANGTAGPTKQSTATGSSSSVHAPERLQQIQGGGPPGYGGGPSPHMQGNGTPGPLGHSNNACSNIGDAASTNGNVSALPCETAACLQLNMLHSGTATSVHAVEAVAGT